MALATDAGFGRISGVSVLAGTLVAYGAFLVVLAIAGGVAAALNVNTDLGSRDLHQLGLGGGIAVAAVLLVSYLFGGYVAGRMARRAGVINGLLVFVLGLLIAAAVGGAVAGLGGTDNVVNGVRSTGLPTSASQWRSIGTVAGIGALLAMLVGSLLGGSMGERWHTKLLTRALDPEVGPEARTRREAESTAATAEEQHLAAEQRVRRSRLTDRRTAGATSSERIADEEQDRIDARDRIDATDRIDSRDRVETTDGTDDVVDVRRAEAARADAATDEERSAGRR